MDGKIYPDTRAKCVECGSVIFPSKMKMSGFEVPLCKCGGHPDKFRLNSYYPDASKKTGKARTGDIRHTDTGQRISDPGTAIYMLKQIEKEIDLGSFNPEKYTAQKNREKYRIDSICEKYLEHNEKRRAVSDNPIGKRTLRDKKSIVKNYIIPIFGDIDIQQFPSKVLRERFLLVQKNRRRVYEELQEVIKFSYQELEIQFQHPVFPPKPKKGYRDETDIPEEGIFWDIVEKLDRPEAKAISVICALYMLRPSDVLTLKPCDMDFKHGVLKIQRHASDGEDAEGRKSDIKKSDRNIHTIPIVPELEFALKLVPDPKGQDEYYFKGPLADDKFYSYSTFNNAWIRARNAADRPGIKFYTAVKHARARDLMTQGISLEIIERISGVSAKVLKEHYLRLRAKDVKSTVLQFDTSRAKKAMGA